MLDKIEYRIAKKLSEYHFYPYGQDIYVGIFRNFSHFPLNLKDIDMDGEGKTITFLALVVHTCMLNQKEELFSFYYKILNILKEKAAAYLQQNITVETLLGCILYYYHPVEIKNVLSTLDVSDIFDDNEIYEYELKKNTILIYTI